MTTDLDRVFESRAHFWRPAQNLSLSEWADKYFYLSPESSAEPGRWTTLPYQRGVMDAITDPTIERVSWMKSARVGATKILNAVIGYYIHQDPCPILAVQPTVEDARGYSREEIAPMVRDVEVLRDLVGPTKVKKSGSTILGKSFPGGVLTLIGANSGTGFRRISRRVVLFDEVDGYPPSAGTEGDQIKLGIQRTSYYWNRKIVAVSTPGIEGASRIRDMFEAGDMRRYHVPCPQCGHRDYLVFREQPDGRGHHMQWPEGDPGAAYFVCSANGCAIEHEHKLTMLEAGEWIAEGESPGHASFHIWAGYSMSPNATWGHIAREFLEAKANVEKLKAFVNTVLGETWQELGDAPDFEVLYRRREKYPIATVPAGVVVVTCGVDVQKDRFVAEVVGWTATKESYSVDALELYGDTSNKKTWEQLEGLLGRQYPATDDPGQLWPIAQLAIDSGYNTQMVYGWARDRFPRVIACKGSATERQLVGRPSLVDVTIKGRTWKRGAKVWPVGVHLAKSEFYGWLRLELDLERDGEDDDGPPEGFCHFPEYGLEYFKQITAEQLVGVRKRSGFTRYEWRLLPNRENHYLDCRVLARVAAAVQGLDRLTGKPRPPATPPKKADTDAPERPRRQRGRGNWLKRRRDRRD